MKKNIMILIIASLSIGFVGCGSGSSGSSTEDIAVQYTAGDVFDVLAGQTITNISGDANITTSTDSDTEITTVTVHSGTVEVL